MKPPCKTMKCILYPVCMNKKRISCQTLREYYEFMMEKNLGLANRTSKTWAGISLVLPKLTSIQGERKNYPSNNIRNASTMYAIDRTYLKPFIRQLKEKSVITECDK